MSHPSDPNFVTGPVGPRVPNNLQTPLPDLYPCPACARHVKFGMECPFCFAIARSSELVAVTKERDELRERLVEVQAESDRNRTVFELLSVRLEAADVRRDAARETIASLEKAYALAVADKVAARQATEEACGAIRKLKAAMRGLCGDE